MPSGGAADREGLASSHTRRMRGSERWLSPDAKVRANATSIWLAGRAEPAVERAARVGDGLIIAGAPDLAGMYREKKQALGKTGPDNVATFAWALPAEDPGRAWEECGPHTTYRARNYANWYGAAADLQSDTTWNASLDAGLNPGASARMFTSVDATIASLKGMEAAGITSVLYFATFPGMRPSATIPYFETMAKYVLPAMR